MRNFSSVGLFGSAAEVGGYHPLLSWAYINAAVPTWRMLLMHWALTACCLARLSAGRRIAIRTAMIPITTRSSTSVKPGRRRRLIQSSFQIIQIHAGAKRQRNRFLWLQSQYSNHDADQKSSKNPTNINEGSVP